VLAPFVVWMYKKQANSIPVYFDFNVYKTFKMSSETLTNGSSVIIYPERACNEFNGVLSGFATGFTFVAQAHHKSTGECIKFYPVYFAQTLKEVHFGKPIMYNPEVPMEEQSIAISDYIFNQIMQLHSKLPPHKVIPMYAVTKKRKMEEKKQKQLVKQEKRRNKKGSKQNNKDTDTQISFQAEENAPIAPPTNNVNSNTSNTPRETKELENNSFNDSIE
jgi:hypothetical protein